MSLLQLRLGAVIDPRPEPFMRHLAPDSRRRVRMLIRPVEAAVMPIVRPGQPRKWNNGIAVHQGLRWFVRLCKLDPLGRQPAEEQRGIGGRKVGQAHKRRFRVCGEHDIR